ncbi:AbrB family transcriptional regulator [Roseibaca sp. V10]|uniref:AbrB family transcriptional regulator n=1 Tax=Roseinatronobacter domitianus TaxID=2940293 RepID=A0ABT0M508_9RHOB|nr:AbrB family transcriptional regulator [Roseibaca domitiana]MCL1629942.1 AbrB family transcriptional regulator [Roseibaca domitiana]
MADQVRMRSPLSDKKTQPPPTGKWRDIVGLTVLFVLSACAGWVFERIGAPLPWMTGPLVFTAAVFMGPAPRLVVPTKLRAFGQVVVATQVGLAFSPEALEMLIAFAPVIVGTALTTGVSIFFVALLMTRLTGQGLAQAFMSAMPTSPVEAATMAAAAGVPTVPVIFSQTFRLAAVVLILPFSLYAIEGGREPVTLAMSDPWHIIMLAVIGLAAAQVFRFLRVPNPNFLGPLTAAAALAASGQGLAPFPPAILALAQIVLGTWLGAIFRREILSSAWRLTLTSALSAVLTLGACIISALGIAALTGVDWRTMVLGAAPGGVVEMALTAKFLEQNFILITTFHLVRIFIFMPNIPWIVRLITRHEQRKTNGENDK